MRRFALLILLLALACAGSVPDDGVLNTSPRHHEWVAVDGPDRAIETFVVYPEIAERAPVVLLIHENRGLTDWVRGLSDEVAAQGYIVVAPDLLSGMAPSGGRTDAFADRNAARDALYTLTDDQVMRELERVADWATGLPAANGRLAVAGFCWGGRRAFQFAAASELPEATFVFYGTPPEADAMSSIESPVYGFYGENDARVTSTVADTETAMASVGKRFEPVVYEGAGHGFMRSGEEAGAEPANIAARRAGWERWMELLESLR